MEYLVLDFFGTVVSLGSLLDSYAALARRLQGLGAEVEPDAFARLYARVLEGLWRREAAPFTRALVEAAGRVGVRLGEGEARRLVLDVIPRRLTAYRDAVEALAIASTSFEGVAIASEGERGVVEEALRALDLDPYVSAVASSEEAGRAKPDPAVVRLALDRLNAPPEAAGVVGDSEEDLEAGAGAGVGFKGLVVRRPLTLSRARPDAVACDLVNMVRLALVG
ncbi:HAD family hydrolase [Stetteria hydrogenophila]